MKKAEMEYLWQGPILDSQKINKWKTPKGKTYKMSMKVYQTTELDVLHAEGFFKNDREAKDSLEKKLASEKNYKYPYKDYPNLVWSVITG
jgi:hypothetical protein